MNKINHDIENHFNNFNRVKYLKKTNTVDKVNTLRKSATDSFKNRGFNSEIANKEKWKFSNIKPIAREKFHILSNSQEFVPNSLDEKIIFHKSNSNRLIFVDGQINDKYSDISLLTEKSLVTTFTNSNLFDKEVINKQLGKLINHENDIFSTINSALLNDGLLINIKKNITLNTPISIIFINTNQNENAATFPRILVVCEENSEASIVEGHISYATQSSLDIPVIEIDMNKNSNLNHYKYMLGNNSGFNISNTVVSLEENSDYNSFSFSTGSKIARNSVDINLIGKYSNCNLNGLYITKDKNHIDNHLNINHKNTHTKSNIFYKGILKDSSRAVFSGRVLVERNAQKTEATQSDKNLLLSPNVRINTKPSLEIYADDVQCAHGATASYFTDEAMFYLQSRGIDQKTAEKLLIEGFAQEIFEQIPSKLVKNFFSEILINTSIQY
ncbi:MAG: Fe-S cluster assembly protein SufD [SAR202 cluster bacterium]|nr:Fe-S cluster assembly protein SufD [SAR202 cluster bacterium]|tara:strand:+ start:26387 stop:27715 length:1329 start_codon:yes stop_codon:yes gene_type:complete